jgi:hypothetical protein
MAGSKGAVTPIPAEPSDFAIEAMSTFNAARRRKGLVSVQINRIIAEAMRLDE